MNENITKINSPISQPKIKWSNRINTLLVLLFTFVSFVIGTICAQFLWRVQVVGIDWKPYLNFDLCIPYLVFFLLALIMLIIKLCVFDKKIRNGFPTKKQYQTLFYFDVVAIIMIILSMSVIPLLLLPVSYDVRVHPAPIICSSLSFILVVSICVLTFYKDV